MISLDQKIMVLDNHIDRGKIGVEIGVWRGDYSEDILRIVHPQKLYLVDPWKAYEGEYHYDKAMWENKSQETLDKIHDGVVRRFSSTPEVEVIRKPSVEAAKDFEDESIDFIYIDGMHNYESVLEDIATWYPKVRIGGKIFGDDYHRSGDWGCGVINAVHESLHNLCLRVVGVYGNQYCLVKTKPYEKNK